MNILVLSVAWSLATCLSPADAVVRPEPLDTIWPVLPGYEPMLDTTLVIPLTSDPDGDAYYRTVITITFEAGVSNAAKAAFFARHSIAVLGVDPSADPMYYVQIPDPGMDIDAFYAAVDSLRAEPETWSVLPIVFRGMRLLSGA